LSSRKAARPTSVITGESTAVSEQVGGTLDATHTPKSSNPQPRSMKVEQVDVDAIDVLGRRVNARILTHAIADLNEVCQRLIKEVSQRRDLFDNDEDETTLLTIRDLEEIVARLTQGIAGLCHVVAPQRHTTLVREECFYAEQMTKPERVKTAPGGFAGITEPTT
jgi:hypothetical protein